MREILFRGKDEFGWIYGDLVHDGNEIGIKTSVGAFIVAPETIGQYTGLCDKNGTKIFEGDIVLYSWLSFGELPFYIEFIDGEFCATPLRQTDDLWQIRISGENLNFEVIGNIHDNPELLEVEL